MYSKKHYIKIWMVKKNFVAKDPLFSTNISRKFTKISRPKSKSWIKRVVKCLTEKFRESWNQTSWKSRLKREFFVTNFSRLNTSENMFYLMFPTRFYPNPKKQFLANFYETENPVSMYTKTGFWNQQKMDKFCNIPWNLFLKKNLKMETKCRIMYRSSIETMLLQGS